MKEKSQFFVILGNMVCKIHKNHVNNVLKFSSFEDKLVLYQLYQFQCQKVTITHFIALFITPTHTVHFIAWWCHTPPIKEL